MSDPTTPDALGAFDARTVLETLFAKARPHLSRQELQHLVKGTDYAQQIAQESARLASGIGCLVLEDAARSGEAGPGAGNFQSAADVPELLFHLGRVFEHIEGLLSVAGQAAHALRVSERAE